MFTLMRRMPLKEFAPLDFGLDDFLASFFNNENSALPSISQAEYPSDTEVFSKDNNLVYRIALPGIDQRDIDLSVENNVLKIKAERKQPHEVNEKDWYSKSFHYGQFVQTYALPQDVNSEEVSADFKNGILEIRVSRNKAAISKKIEVKQLESATA